MREGEGPELIPNEVMLQVNQPLTNISIAYMLNQSFLGELFGNRGPHEPRPVMSDAIHYTALRRRTEADPTAQSILELHRPDLMGCYSYCEGCPGGIEEAADWPCATIDLLERLFP